MSPGLPIVGGSPARVLFFLFCIWTIWTMLTIFKISFLKNMTFLICSALGLLFVSVIKDILIFHQLAFSVLHFGPNPVSDLKKLMVFLDCIS